MGLVSFLSLPKIPSGAWFVHGVRIVASSCVMPLILYALAIAFCDLLKSRRRLQAENLFLRHQLNIALRRALPRPRLRGSDRALLVWMALMHPGLLHLTQVVKPETVLRWHRAGFRCVYRKPYPY